MAAAASSSSRDISCGPPLSCGYIFPADRKPYSIEDVYPHDVHPLLKDNTRYSDVKLLQSAACKIYSLDITDENRIEFQEELTSMEKLSSKLTHALKVSYEEAEYLSEEQMLLCTELAKKVPGILKMDTYADLAGCQQTMISSYLYETKCREVVAASYNPQDAQVLQALMLSYNAEQLAQILRIPFDLAEKLKEKLPKAFDDSPVPAPLPKNLTATMDPREPAQPQFNDRQLEDIRGALQAIFLNMTMHQERIGSCLNLLRIVNRYIMALRPRLGILKKDAVMVTLGVGEGKAVEQNLSWDLRIFVDNLPLTFDIAEVVSLLLTAGNVQMVRFFCDNQAPRRTGFGFVTMSSAEEAQAAPQKLNGLKIGGRRIKVNYGPPSLGERFQFGGEGGSDSSRWLYVDNLSRNVDHQALGTLFSEHGNVLEARVVYDSTGKSKGFGFVTYGSAEDGEKALTYLNGVNLCGRAIGVYVANTRQAKAPSSRRTRG